MDPSEWIARFRITHEKAKSGLLKDDQLKDYLGMREELARSLVAAQALQTPEGKTARRFFRVAQMYRVELAHTYQSMTKMVSCSGFSTAISSEFKPGQVTDFEITLARDKDPVTGKAKVVSCVKQGQFQISLSIETISEANAERLESALFDSVLSRYK